jgi:hypothetical protein
MSLHCDTIKTFNFVKQSLLIGNLTLKFVYLTMISHMYIKIIIIFFTYCSLNSKNLLNLYIIINIFKIALVM